MFPNDVSVIICGQGQLYKVPSVTQKEMSECWPQSIPAPKGPGPEERLERFELCPRFEKTVAAFSVCGPDRIRSLGNSRFIFLGFILFYFILK